MKMPKPTNTKHPARALANLMQRAAPDVKLVTRSRRVTQKQTDICGVTSMNGNERYRIARHWPCHARSQYLTLLSRGRLWDYWG
jgi:hypothetical protein